MNSGLICVPFGHYDEPEILRYAITSIRPIGADVRQQRAKCGHTVLSGEAAELARYIESLAEDRPRAVRLGENARRVFEREFSKSLALAKWKAIVDGTK